ncbi:MAG: GNAT family N-acetyltransferase [Clostridia bacterium]|nr:GNAT family N-acetyltransferase [Clostridia bacterium]
MVRIEKVKPEGEILETLLKLSEDWTREGITHGYIPNKPEDVTEPCLVARIDGGIAGYAFGHYYNKETRNSFIEPGVRCFELDELYVVPEHRSAGVGALLFRAMEEEVRDAEFMTLNAATKDWRKILGFYADKMDMVFHSAHMIKPLGKK